MQHIELLKSHIANGTLIRGAWVGEDAHGRQTACLLAALVPQCGEYQSASPCPASVMPKWLAYLTPDLDDRGSIEAWPGWRWHRKLRRETGEVYMDRWQLVRVAFEHWDNIGWPEDKGPIAALRRAMELLGDA